MKTDVKQSPVSLPVFVKTVPGFEALSEKTLTRLASQFHPLRYPMGRAIATAKAMPLLD